MPRYPLIPEDDSTGPSLGSVTSDDGERYPLLPEDTIPLVDEQDGGLSIIVEGGPAGPAGPTGPAGPAGVAGDHGALTGLADDDHPQYQLAADLGDSALLDVGTTTGFVAAGDDSRFTDTVATSRLGTTGTASETTFLRGDQAWASLGDVGAYKTSTELVLPGLIPGVATTQAAYSRDTPFIDITGDIDIRMNLSLTDWTPATDVSPLSKWGAAGFRSWYLRITSLGKLGLAWSANGTDTVTGGPVLSTVPSSTTDGVYSWVRATLRVDNGENQHELKFYTSTDGVTWTQLGNTRAFVGTTSIFSSSSDLSIGTTVGFNPVPMSVKRVTLHSTIGGTTPAPFDVLFSGGSPNARVILEVAGGNNSLIFIPGLAATAPLSAALNSDPRLNDQRGPVWSIGRVDNADRPTGHDAKSAGYFQIGTMTTARTFTLTSIAEIGIGKSTLVFSGAGCSETNTLTVQAYGTETINGSNTYVITEPNRLITFYSNTATAPTLGPNWVVDAGPTGVTGPPGADGSPGGLSWTYAINTGSAGDRDPGNDNVGFVTLPYESATQIVVDDNPYGINTTLHELFFSVQSGYLLLTSQADPSIYASWEIVSCVDGTMTNETEDGSYVIFNVNASNMGYGSFTDGELVTLSINVAGPQGPQGDPGLDSAGYLTTSVSSMTLNAGTKTLTVDTGLAYSIAQSVVIANDVDHHLHGTVVSYNSTTGVLVVDHDKHTGTGTFSSWVINIDGAITLNVGTTAGTVAAGDDARFSNWNWLNEWDDSVNYVLGDVVYLNTGTYGGAWRAIASSNNVNPSLSVGSPWEPVALPVTGTLPITVGSNAVSIAAATTSAAGSMSSADFTKLAGVASGATSNTVPEQYLRGTGYWHTTPYSATATSYALGSTTMANACTQTHVSPIYLDRTTTYDAIGVQLVTPATDTGAVIELGWCPALTDRSGSPDYTAITSAGNISATAVAGEYSLPVSVTLTAGTWYLLAALKSATTKAGTVPAIRGTIPPMAIYSATSLTTNAAQMQRGSRATDAALTTTVAGAPYATATQPTVGRIGLKVLSWP